MVLAQAFTLIGKAVRSLRNLAARLSSDRGGNVVMIFALVMPALIMITLGGIDINRITTVKARVQDALDAAALAAARSSHTDPVKLREVAVVALRANLRNASVEPFADSDLKIQLTSSQVVIADLKVQVKTLVANIVLPPYGKLLDDTLPVNVHSEVNRSSKNIEVALVLDVTGSMKGTRIASLKDAARQLVQLVVHEQQTPYYSRMAIIPYSSGVNLNADDFGDYRTAARGAPIGPKSISDISWGVGAVKAITAVTQANTGYITSKGHGFQNGQVVGIRDVEGMTELNGKAFRVANVSTDTFSLESWNGSTWQRVSTANYSRYTRRGSVQRCQLSDCAVVITANRHGLLAKDAATGFAGTVYFTNVGGMTQINNRGFEIANVTTNTYSINVVGPAVNAYTSGGNSYCGADGCEYRVYRNVSGSLLSYPLSDCATERTGSDRYKEISATTSNVGRLYPSSSGDNLCTSSPILPLTDNRDAMYDLIGESAKVNTGLQAGGFTAGQVGLAWGWYAVSPNFSGFWPTAPAEYDPQKTLKAVILMTDGEFNMPHCSGVMARDADTTSSQRIACDAPNGEPFAQAVALCDAIKKSGDSQGIIVYTVGFSVSSNRGGPGIDTARELLENCASSTSQAFFPATGADLTESFKAIGRDITRLRISR